MLKLLLHTCTYKFKEAGWIKKIGTYTLEASWNTVYLILHAVKWSCTVQCDSALALLAVFRDPIQGTHTCRLLPSRKIRRVWLSQHQRAPHCQSAPCPPYMPFYSPAHAPIFPCHTKSHPYNTYPTTFPTLPTTTITPTSPSSPPSPHLPSSSPLTIPPPTAQNMSLIPVVATFSLMNTLVIPHKLGVGSETATGYVHLRCGPFEAGGVGVGSEGVNDVFSSIQQHELNLQWKKGCGGMCPIYTYRPATLPS